MLRFCPFAILKDILLILHVFVEFLQNQVAFDFLNQIKSVFEFFCNRGLTGFSLFLKHDQQSDLLIEMRDILSSVIEEKQLIV